MTCSHGRRLFSRHLDDRLSPDERQALDAHLSECAACRAELVRWEVPSRALRAMGAAQEPVPAGAADRMWRAVLAEMTTRVAPASFEERFVWAARRAVAMGALAAALIWGGLLLGEPGPSAAAELSHPDATEWAMTLWSAEPAAGFAPEGDVDVE
jgi:anti-sigma factor RsiW